MKKLGFILVVLFIVGLYSCEQSVDFSRSTIYSDDTFTIEVNGENIITLNDIDYYDFSTHIIYLKKDNPLNTDSEKYASGSGLSFKVKVYSEEIYTGLILPSYSSLGSHSPMISIMPSFYPDDVIHIESGRFNMNVENDLRNDERIIAAMKKTGKYHAGLSFSIDGLGYSKTAGLDFIEVHYTITNNDTYNYFVLDPEKSGLGTFLYFTNGLAIKTSNAFCYTKIEHEQPTPWNSWNKSWMTIIPANTQKSFTIKLSFDRLPAGSYETHMEFPGMLYQVSKDERIQKDGRFEGRVWLGSLIAYKNLTVR